ncbi:MAG: hypothetical protein ACLQM6_07075 [Acidobacteriaceae bacterium]
MTALREQGAIPVTDPENYDAVHAAIEAAFTAARVRDFLGSMLRARLRIRDFEQVLRTGILGAKTEAEYGRLGNGDQGLIREFYLASLEKVAPELRTKFFKLYAYY